MCMKEISIVILHNEYWEFFVLIFIRWCLPYLYSIVGIVYKGVDNSYLQRSHPLPTFGGRLIKFQKYRANATKLHTISSCISDIKMLSLVLYSHIIRFVNESILMLSILQVLSRRIIFQSSEHLRYFNNLHIPSTAQAHHD